MFCGSVDNNLQNSSFCMFKSWLYTIADIFDGLIETAEEQSFWWPCLQLFDCLVLGLGFDGVGL